MRQAARQIRREQVSGVYSVPAPVGGWNARDSIANMQPTDAIKLLNWFPTTVDCVIRGGNEDYASGITGTVETLASYDAMSGTNKLFAVDDNDVWDVSASGAASAQSTTVTNGKWQWVNFGDGTNNYLYMVNGTDAPLTYNGSSWVVVTGVSTPALTGVTLTNLIHINVHKGRLYFVEKNSLSFWYLAAGAAGGALTKFDLSSYAKRGGYLMWMATWTFDSGDGPDDAAVFMTSEGEVIVYRGTDPSTAANWVLTGVFHLAKPIGRRSFIKYGGDLIAITQNGAFPLSKALTSSELNNEMAVTNKIEKEFTSAATLYQTNFGWEAVLYPLQNAFLINIPVSEGGEHKQYVMNTITGSWCEFDSWDAECFIEYNGDLYFGMSTVVQKAWSGTDDDGSEIIAEGKTAFSYFGNTSQQKRFTLFRPLLQVNGDISFLSGLDVDFEDTYITGTSTYTVNAVALWDTAIWDSAIWTSGLQVVRKWSSPNSNVGYCAAGKLKINTDSLEVHWVANDYVYQQGGVL